MAKCTQASPPASVLAIAIGPKLLPRHLEHRVLVVVRIEQRIRHVAVAVRPAVDGDRGDVARAGEAARPQHAVEIVADALLEIGEGHRVELALADAELRAGVEALVRRAGHMDQCSSIGSDGSREWRMPPRLTGKSSDDLMVETHRRRDRTDLEVREGAPVADQHVGVADRRLDVLRQRLALRLRQVRRDVRDHHVEAGEHGVARLDPMQLAGADIGDLRLAAVLPGVNTGRIEPDADRLVGRGRARHSRTAPARRRPWCCPAPRRE